MLSRLTQFYRCTKGIPFSQLCRRAELQLKRQLYSSALGKVFQPSYLGTATLKQQLPTSRFSPRDHLLQRIETKPFLNQLGSKIPLTPPIDWKGTSQNLRHLDRLTLHYHEFLETLRFDEGLAVIDDWIDHNPLWKKGYWLDSWNSYAISIRVVCWLQWLALYREQLPTKTLSKILASISQQLQFLLQNLETDICGNHLLKNIRCLLWASACLEGDFGRKLETTGYRWLQRELNTQLLADGMHFELSPAYHCQIFTDLVDCYLSLNERDREILGRRIDQAAQVLQDLTHPDGLISLMSDGGLHMVYSPAECLATWAEISRNQTVPTEHFHLVNSGYAGARTPRTYLLFDAGPSCANTLPAHGHGDLLSFEWDVDQKRFVVDPGVFEYESGPERKRNRSAFSHNVVVVDDWDQCEFVGSFRTGWRNHANLTAPPKPVDSYIEMCGKYYHRLGQFKHRRILRCKNEGLLVEDHIEGIQRHAVAKLLINGEFKLNAASDHSLEFVHQKTRIILASPFRLSYEKAFWSPDFGLKSPATQILIDYGRESGKFGFEFTICN